METHVILRRSERGIAVAVAAGLSGVALFLTGLWVGSARGGSAEDPGAKPRTLPDWFLPIADAYDRNPEITPAFDFAQLYDSRPASYRLSVERPRR